jgi:hypothetical protein
MRVLALLLWGGFALALAAGYDTAAYGDAARDEVFREAWLLVKPLSMEVARPGQNYPTLNDLDAHAAAKIWARYYNDTVNVQMLPALERIRQEAADEEFQMSDRAAEADAAQNSGVTHLGKGVLAELFCSKDDNGRESQGCQTARDHAAKSAGNAIDYLTSRSLYWKERSEFAAAVSWVEPVLDNNSGSGEAAIGLTFHECCLRQSNQGFHYDLLEIRNESTEDLTTAVIRVRVIGRNGEYVDVWHYLDSVAAGSTLYTAYGEDSGFRGASTVPNVTRIEARVWSPYTQPRTFALDYAGAVKESDIAGFAETLKARIDRYLPPDSNGARGVAVSFNRHVHDPYDINITFRNASQVCGLTESWDDWVTDNPWEFRSTSLSCDPQQIFIAIKFKASTVWYTIGSATMR